MAALLAGAAWRVGRISDAPPVTAHQTGAARIVNATVDIGACELGDRIFFSEFER